MTVYVPDSLCVRCDACNAEPYEPCRPYCVARPDELDTCQEIGEQVCGTDRCICQFEVGASE